MISLWKLWRVAQYASNSESSQIYFLLCFIVNQGIKISPFISYNYCAAYKRTDCETVQKWYSRPLVNCIRGGLDHHVKKPMSWTSPQKLIIMNLGFTGVYITFLFVLNTWIVDSCQTLLYGTVQTSTQKWCLGDKRENYHRFLFI